MPVPSPNGITVVEFLSAYFTHAEGHYRDADGRPTSEMAEVKIVVRTVRELYGELPVAEFGPLALKATRQKWVNAGRARSECNRRAAVVKRICKWAVSEELGPSAVYHALATVTGLARGREKRNRSGRSMKPQ